jgi:hypothetical protein
LSESLAVEEYIIKRACKEKELLGKDCKEEANVKMLIGVISDF